MEKKEVEVLSKWGQELDNVTSLAGKKLKKNSKIAELEVMISMDSCNMHLISLVGTRVSFGLGARIILLDFWVTDNLKMIL